MAYQYTDAQILQNFTDGLGKASSAAMEIATKPFIIGVSRILPFLDGMKQASAAAHQFAHARQDPNFFNIRDQLDRMRATVTHRMPNNAAWVAISGLLHVVMNSATILADARALPRKEVLKMLDKGEANIARRVEAQLIRDATVLH